MPFALTVKPTLAVEIEEETPLSSLTDNAAGNATADPRKEVVAIARLMEKTNQKQQQRRYQIQNWKRRNETDSYRAKETN